MPKVSVIIPVYNIMPYLEKCLDSVISQSMQEIEIIVVNDGSTDGSDIIINRYGEMDNRVRAIHKTNEGVVQARISGIEAATADYVLYLDGDDFLEPNALKVLYNEAIQTNADIIVSDFWCYEPLSGKKYSSVIKSEFPQTTTIEYLNAAFHGKAYWAVWTYLFKRSFYEKSQISHYKDISFGEDILFTTQLFLQNAKFSKITAFTVNYVQRDTSLSGKKTYSDKQYSDMLAYCKLVKEIVEKSPYAGQLHHGVQAVTFSGQAASFAYNYFKNGTQRSRYILKTLIQYPEFREYIARRQMKLVKAYALHPIVGKLLTALYKKRGKL